MGHRARRDLHAKRVRSKRTGCHSISTRTLGTRTPAPCCTRGWAVLLTSTYLYRLAPANRNVKVDIPPFHRLVNEHCTTLDALRKRGCGHPDSNELYKRNAMRPTGRIVLSRLVPPTLDSSPSPRRCTTAHIPHPINPSESDPSMADMMIMIENLPNNETWQAA
ncbi:hypothetical protein VTO73DRAFT_1614 [Trametes versicolor]